MSEKFTLEAKMIAAYLLGGSRRRASSVLSNSLDGDAQGVASVDGVLTVRKAINSQPVSALGGPTKVFGRSRISIPDFKRPRG
ncbi:MAG: hypothetical protein V4693_18760 [Pseudomonadota bacterium]